jgi:predicted small lipoprotein YifL
MQIKRLTSLSGAVGALAVAAPASFLLQGCGQKLPAEQPPAAQAAPPSLAGSWVFSDLRGDGGPASVDGVISQHVLGGKHIIRFRTTKGGSYRAARRVALPQGARALELSFSTRYQNVVGADPWWDGGRVFVGFRDQNGRELGGEIPPLRALSGTSTGWVTRKVRFLVPEGAAALEVMPALHGAKSGTIEYTDFALDTVDLKDQPVAPVAELKVVGNKLVTLAGEEVWLQGVSVDSMQWGGGENILLSIHIAMDEWHANAIRLPVVEEHWFGRHPEHGSAEQQERYRKLVDDAVALTAEKGGRLIIDLHRFRAPLAEHVEFWRDVAERYKNHPAVLFEIFNEPHDISWEVWRNGGQIPAGDSMYAGEKVEATHAGKQSVGMQALVDAIRKTGAKNIILPGGLDWGYDLSGVLNGYALDDRGGNGFMYVSHIYPWKGQWKEKVLAAAEKYPVIITEVGAHDEGERQENPHTWAPDMLGLIQKYKLHWTGFSFHPTCAPPMLSDWDYSPSIDWGQYAKAALAGEKFELERYR